MQIRNPVAPFERADLTGAVRNIPIQWGTFNNLGIFTEEPVTTQTVVFEETTQDGALIVDRVRGDRNSVSKDQTRKLHSFVVPHFPLDDFITPKDLQARSAYTNFDEVETLDKVVAEKLRRIRQNHDFTLNKARAQALFSSTVYAPSGTVSQNWDTEFSITRTAVDFVLGTAGTEVLSKIETVIQAIQDANGNGGGMMTGIVAPVSTGFFNKLISHASVKAAYTYQQNRQAGFDPIGGRLAAGGSPLPMNREFYFGGINFVEVRDSYNSTSIVTANEGVAVPSGTDNFKTYFAPAERFGLVNTLGEQVYVFQEPEDTKITLESESNHVSALLRPATVIRLYTSN